MRGSRLAISSDPKVAPISAAIRTIGAALDRGIKGSLYPRNDGQIASDIRTCHRLAGGGGSGRLWVLPQVDHHHLGDAEPAGTAPDDRLAHLRPGWGPDPVSADQDRQPPLQGRLEVRRAAPDGVLAG